VAGRLTAAEAAEAARRTRGLLAEADAARVTALGRAAAGLASRLGREQGGDLAEAAARALLDARAQAARPDGPAEGLLPTLRDTAEWLGEQALVELLKQPTCVGAARDALQQALGRRLGQTFADRWALADWLDRHRLDLDLAAPPRRPGR
jgi:hypothetical protein